MSCAKGNNVATPTLPQTTTPNNITTTPTNPQTTTPAQTSFCGNGIIEGIEKCDLSALNNETCENLGYLGGGTLACSNLCDYDVSGCIAEAVDAEVTSYGDI
jgi:hypothetical protein